MRWSSQDARAGTGPPASAGWTPGPEVSAAARLGGLLRRLRTLHGLTQAGLGRQTGYHGSYISSVERALVRPSRELVERCDDVLGAGGVLVWLWTLGDRERPLLPPEGPGPGPGAARPADGPPGPGPADRPDPGRSRFEAVEVARQAEASGLGAGTLAGV
jgi:hypothetical protein